MKIYATYDQYKSEHHGTLTQDDFNRLVVKASLHLDKITFDRLKVIGDEDIIDRVSRACCEMVDLIHDFAEGEDSGKTIKSISNDGYSVTYVTESDGAPDQLSMKLTRIAVFWLPSWLTSYVID